MARDNTLEVFAKDTLEKGIPWYESAYSEVLFIPEFEQVGCIFQYISSVKTL